MAISVFSLLIPLALLIGLGLLVYLAARSLIKCSPTVAFTVLGIIFALLLGLVLSIPTLRYQSACRNLGSSIPPVIGYMMSSCRPPPTAPSRCSATAPSKRTWVFPPIHCIAN